MKSDFEILIEHLQSEYDYLKSSMDQYAAKWDFESARAFREPLIFTRRKLNILKCLKNPNYNKINRLAGMISRMEKTLSERKFVMDYLEKQSRQRIEEYFNESTKNRIKKSKKELDILQSIIPTQRVDNDKIYQLLEDLERNEIREIEFEIKKDKIFLLLRINNQQSELEFRVSENKNLEHYLTKPARSVLSKLGFDTETYKKRISNSRNMDKVKILEELAIIYFEVFGIFKGKFNLKIK